MRENSFKSLFESSRGKESIDFNSPQLPVNSTQLLYSNIPNEIWISNFSRKTKNANEKSAINFTNQLNQIPARLVTHKVCFHITMKFPTNAITTNAEFTIRSIHCFNLKRFSIIPFNTFVFNSKTKEKKNFNSNIVLWKIHI